ncbi:MAG: hypothetical protein U7123_12495 [Potamolinea sp.]
MNPEKTRRVRLSVAEFAALKAHDEATDRLISEVIGDFIKELNKKSRARRHCPELVEGTGRYSQNFR